MNIIAKQTARPAVAGARIGFAPGASRFVALLLCLMMLGGCATNTTAERDRTIEQRAQERWDALLAGDYATAYSYASPGYRSSTSATDFEIDSRARRVQYISAEYLDHSCEELVCSARVRVGYTVIRPVTGVSEWKSTQVIDERWVNVDGKWWFVPES